MHRGVWEIRELSWQALLSEECLGGSIGGLIGDNNHGWRGGYRGSAIGNIVGTIAGAAIGNALTAPRQEPIEEDAYIPEVREVRVRKYKKQPQVQRPLTQLKLQQDSFY